MAFLNVGSTVPMNMLSLRVLPHLAAAQGLEGTVKETTNTPYLCKVFDTPLGARAADAVQSLIDFREFAVAGKDREIVRSHFSWPVHRVTDSATGQTIGVLIPRAEPRFYYRHEVAWHLREGQHLPRAKSAAGSFDPAARLAVLRDMARAFDLLDRYGYVYGDANSRNLAFATSGTPTVYLLDCDGIRRAGDPAMAHRFQGRWNDPDSNGVNSIQSDRYLLALWCYRVLTRTMDQPRPGHKFGWGVLPIPLSSTPALQRLLQAGLGATGSRPAAADYLPLLEALHRQA